MARSRGGRVGRTLQISVLALVGGGLLGVFSETRLLPRGSEPEDYAEYAETAQAPTPATKADRPTPAAPPRAGDAAPAPNMAGKPPQSLFACPKITIRNAPALGPKRGVVGYKPFATVNSVKLAVVPTVNACLTSGFGSRNGKLHRGVDYQGRPAGQVYAAADGTVLEAQYRGDYGYYVLIDHGADVHTRYAHLQNIARDVTPGSMVRFGQRLGRMGKSGDYGVALHLHYELLLGDYDNPKKAFGLAPKNIFDYL